MKQEKFKIRLRKRGQRKLFPLSLKAKVLIYISTLEIPPRTEGFLFNYTYL